jgi:Mn-containing catalase
VQELLGGKFGEMSTLMNYTFQSFNFRGRSKMKPFYDLIANIGAEEYGHIELVSHTINMLLTGDDARKRSNGYPVRRRGGYAQPLPLHRQRAVSAAGRFHG